MRDKIIAFFDAAKDLALEITSKWASEQATPDDPSGIYAQWRSPYDEEIEICVSPPEGHTTIQIYPKHRASVIAVTCLNGPGEFYVTSILPTIPDPGGKPVDRLMPDMGGLDVAFFNTGWPKEVCPFDFGVADPDLPISIEVKRIATVTECPNLRMKIFATYLPESAVTTAEPEQAH